METIFLDIPGDPVPIFRENHNIKIIRDTYEDNRCRAKIWLENQWGEKDAIKEPVNIEMTFYMSKTHYKTKTASLIDCFRFIDQISRGLIYKKIAQLTKVSLEKIMSKNPHTTIVIKGL